MLVHIATLGCKVNQYESDRIIANLKQNGIGISDTWLNADVVIVNSCVVTNRAEQKSSSLLRKIKRENPDARLILTGCMADKKHGDYGQTDIGNDRKVEVVLQTIGIHSAAITGAGGAYERTRAYIKIQDGCNAFCSYCIIPFVRGRERDESFDDIIAEASNAVNNGFREIVLTGIHTGRFKRLAELLDALEAIEGLQRIRLSSIELREVDEQLVRRFQYGSKIVPHLHIPLQSGSDTVLKAMKRPYTRQEFIDRCNELRSLIPELGITTDIIVGFPQETDDDFQQTLDVIEQLAIHRVHVFPYSQREGTPASEMTEQVSAEVKKLRAAKARTHAFNIFRRFCADQADKVHKVLIEEYQKNDIVAGYTENYIYTEFTCQGGLVNQITDVVLTEPIGSSFACKAKRV